MLITYDNKEQVIQDSKDNGYIRPRFSKCPKAED